MNSSPFIEDPRDELARAISAAVESPIEAVRAIHLRRAEHHAAMARENGLPMKDAVRPPAPPDGGK